MNDQLTTDEARDSRQPESEGRVVLQRLISGDVEITLRVLWRTSGFLSGLAQDIKALAPDRAQMCREFVDCIEAEARRLSANAKLRDAGESGVEQH